MEEKGKSQQHTLLQMSLEALQSEADILRLPVLPSSSITHTQKAEPFFII